MPMLKISNLKKINPKFADALDPYLNLLTESALRLANLVELSQALMNDKNYFSNDSVNEILRLVVVFLHATLEEFLRTLASRLLFNSNEDALDKIPLAGLNNSRHPEKFLLWIRFFRVGNRSD
jgi:hypothetical protein